MEDRLMMRKVRLRMRVDESESEEEIFVARELEPSTQNFLSAHLLVPMPRQMLPETRAGMKLFTQYGSMQGENRSCLGCVGKSTCSLKVE